MARKIQTVADVGWSFLTAMENSGAPASTRRRYKSNMFAMLEAFGARSITGVRPPDLAEWIDAGTSPDIRTARRTIANRVMAHAHRRGFTATRIQVPDSDYTPRGDRHREWTRYSADQLRLLKESAPCERSRVAISIASYTGMRIDDIRILRVPAPNLAEQWMATFIQKSGIFDFKVISGGLEEDLRRYLTWLYRRADGVLTTEDYLIPAYPRKASGVSYDAEAIDFGTPLGYNTLGDRYVAARTAAGLPHLPRERWHAIRRSSGRLFFEAASRWGYDTAMRMTQAFLNHSSMATTERYIGLDSAYAMRDEFLRSHDFLAVETDNILPLNGRLHHG